MIEKTPVDPAVRKLFAKYEKAFAALDMKTNAAMFADTFISAGSRVPLGAGIVQGGRGPSGQPEGPSPRARPGS